MSISRSRVPEMLTARKEVKTAYFKRDKLVTSDIKHSHPRGTKAQDQISRQLTLEQYF